MDASSNGLSDSLANHSHGHGYHNHGWQQVTNVRKQKRQESRDAKKSEKEASVLASAVQGGGAVYDGSVFTALDKVSEERRARLAAKLALTDDDDVEEGEEEDDGKDITANGTDAKTDGELKKPKEKKPKKPKVTVSDAGQALNVTDLSNFLTDVTESFAQLPDVQLLRCADYFARSFSGVTTSQFCLSKFLKDHTLVKAIEMPLCDVPEDVVTTTANWLTEKPIAELGKFALFLIKGVLEEFQGSPTVKKGTPVSVAPSKAKVGLMVVLSILLRKRPDVLLPQAEAIRNGPEFNGQDRLQALAWVYGQVAQADLISGMWLWVRNFLPLAVGKQSTPLSRDVVLTFYESVICKNLGKARTTLLNGASKKGERLVPPSALDMILRAAFPPESQKTKATERFTAAYVLVKEIGLAGAFQVKNTKPAAVQLLPLSLAAAGEEPPALSEEACGNFIWCLSQNPGDCYRQWEKHHMENLHASSRILSYLLREWKSAHGRLTPFTDLRKTLLSMRRKHREVLASTTTKSEQEKLLKKTDGVCKVLLSRISSFPTCLKAGGTLVVAAAMAYGFYLVSPTKNPWGWDGWILLSETHPIF